MVGGYKNGSIFILIVSLLVSTKEYTLLKLSSHTYVQWTPTIGMWCCTSWEPIKLMRPIGKHLRVSDFCPFFCPFFARFLSVTFRIHQSLSVPGKCLSDIIRDSYANYQFFIRLICIHMRTYVTIAYKHIFFSNLPWIYTDKQILYVFIRFSYVWSNVTLP